MAIESPPAALREAVQAQLKRILASQVFAKSDRMSRFLRFVVEKTLDGQNDELKEYAIALEVFHKDESIDPRIDPAVRSDGRRLRAKLTEYYDANGNDKIAIELPKGAYSRSLTSGNRRVARRSRSVETSLSLPS